MDQEKMTRWENVGFSLASYVILAAAGVVGLRFGSPLTAPLRWVIITLLAAIAVIQTRVPERGSARWKVYGFLGAYGVLAAVLMFLQPGWTMYPVLYISPIMYAILTLPLRQGVAWIAAYTTATAASFAVGISLGEGLIAAFLYGVLYLFMGAFASTLARAEAEQRKSQALLGELQVAHRQLQEQAFRAEALAVSEERNRLAREMHDTLGHRLTVAAVQLEGAQRLIPVDPERAAGMVRTVREQVREALGELRRTVAALRAPLEADLSLPQSLARLAADFEAATCLPVHRIVPEDLPELPGLHRLALYRAAQEGLTNVQRHAEARQVWLVVSVQDGAVTLLVSDDGKGLSLSPGRLGFGLHGLHERAAQLGGEMHLEPRPGGGTQLSFKVPAGNG